MFLEELVGPHDAPIQKPKTDDDRGHRVTHHLDLQIRMRTNEEWVVDLCQSLATVHSHSNHLR